MMPKCNKVKNPCKICLGPVSKSTGLQCQGACQSWVHYECLNYTPGKIKDIKAGVIRVTCPCPDCKTKLPKEYRTDEPFSCNNTQCPANTPPKCRNVGCPINKGTGGYAAPPTPLSTGCALDKCGKSCKPNSHPHLANAPTPAPIKPCAPDHYQMPMAESASSDSCLDYNRCPSGCASNDDVPGDYGRNNNNANIPSFGTLEEMCNTVGQLSNQINELMMKMQAVQFNKPGSANRPCVQKGPRSLCPKPCFCPGNPGRRN